MLPTRERRSARVLVLDASDRVLLVLLRIQRSDGPFAFWCPPGGAVEPGESDAEAAARELHEELGLHFRLSGPVHVNRSEFEFEGFWNRSTDVFFAARIDDAEPVLHGVNDEERSALLEWRWFAADDLHDAAEPYFPNELAALLAKAQRCLQ